MPFVDAMRSRTLAFSWAGSPSTTRCTGRARPVISPLDKSMNNSMNNSAFNPPSQVANQNPPLAFTAKVGGIG